MRGYNIIVVCDPALDRILMCKRRREPFRGLYNLVGGKIERGETGEQAAYRELLEETSIGRDDIALHHLMDITYYADSYALEVYAGRLRREVAVSGEENELYWIDMQSDFFNAERFAGNGNIGHIMANVKAYIEAL